MSDVQRVSEGERLRRWRLVLGGGEYAVDRKVLEAIFQYSHEQGFSERALTIEELFHKSTLGLSEE